MMLRTGSYLQDRYEIIGQIGSGGMSEVYKAKDHKLNRPVAIKVLKEEFCDDDNFVSRFRMEAQSAAGLMHPNIVNVYDVEDEGDIHYIVMELIEGITLKDYIAKRGHLDIKESVGIAIQVSEGIAAAHEQNIIHRDIKPQNMLIALDGKVKVADFGIARPIASQTVESAAMGSVHYISPEQARGGISDERSDIYSLGITMYEMVTGKLPFDGTSTVSIALSHIEDAMVPPSVYNPDVPAPLERIILKCCEKKPERRYQNINQLIADLRQVLMMPDDELETGTQSGVIAVTSAGIDSQTRKISEEEMAIINQATKEVEEQKEDESSNGAGAPYSGTVNETPFHETSGSGSGNPSTPRTSAGSGRTGNGSGLGNGDRQNGGGRGRNGGGGSGNGYDRNGDGYYDPSDEEPDDERRTGFEHIFAIAGIAAAVILIVILIVVFLRLGGVFQAGADLIVTEASTEADEEGDDDDELAGTEVHLPNVVGMTEDLAARTLKDSSLNVKYTYEESDTVEEGIVISQDPEAGGVALRWSDVTIVVSSGTDIIDITSLELDNATMETATQILNSHNLNVLTIEVSDEEVPAGVVISYTPEQAVSGSTVTLTVSTGPVEPTPVLTTVEVPDIVGMTEEDAIALLAESGLTPGQTELEYSDTVEAGCIISQSGGEDGWITTGGSIDYVISAGPGEGTYETLSSQRYVASINDVYELKGLIGPGAGTATVTILIRLHQNTNGTDIYEELTGPITVTGDVLVPISYTSIESLNGTDQGEVEVVNADTGEVLASYSLTFFPMN